MEKPEDQLPQPFRGENEEMFLTRLEEAIRKKLINQTEAFFQILYRLDVSEEKVKALMHSTLPEFWPQKFANLIWEREKKRRDWKARYESNGGTS